MGLVRAAAADLSAEQEPETRMLRAATFNLHAGRAVKGVSWLIGEEDPDLIFAQEVRSIGKLCLAAPGWHVLPDQGAGAAVHSAVLADKRRFDLIDYRNPLICPGPDSGMRPARHLPQVRLLDKRTGRIVVAMSVHTHVGRYTRSHQRLLHAVAAAVERRAADRLVLAGGDWNEHLGAAKGPRSARGVLGKAGMVEAAVALGRRPVATAVGGVMPLDGIFHRDDPHVKVVSRRTVRVPVRGADHKAVVATYRLTVKP
jgi:endonuclease/exonuclease/phosphatase (EEP) superfamily protein YafD